VRVASRIAVIGLVIVAVLLAAAGAAATVRRARPSTAVVRFPCLDSAQDGWLAVKSDVGVMQVQWFNDDAKVGVGRLGSSTLAWKLTSRAEAQALARRLAAPLAIAPPHDRRRLRPLWVRAACPSGSASWEGGRPQRPSYRSVLGGARVPGARARGARRAGRCAR
jgi:hypothetical protein